MSDEGNPAKPVRDEDAFDVEAVAGWLREHATAFREDLEGTPEVRQFPGGASNLTYLLRYSPRGRAPEIRHSGTSSCVARPPG